MKAMPEREAAFLDFASARVEENVVPYPTATTGREKQASSTDYSNGEISSEQITLTDRELRILDCISHGMVNKQIAPLVFISTRTLQVHTRPAIVKKLGARNSAHAVRIGFEAGLLR